LPPKEDNNITSFGKEKIAQKVTNETKNVTFFKKKFILCGFFSVKSPFETKYIYCWKILFFDLFLRRFRNDIFKFYVQFMPIFFP